ncbi:hypothetical protein DOY81_003853, partial [Sarcophaga bullata]
KRNDNFVGIFKNRTPQLLVTSPELARRVYVSDFKHLHDNEHATLIKNMFPVTMEISKRTTAYIEQHIKVPNKGSVGSQAEYLAYRFMNDIIVDCVMGLWAPLLSMQAKMYEYSFMYTTLVGLFPGILARHPEVQEKLRTEIKENLDSKRDFAYMIMKWKRAS